MAAAGMVTMTEGSYWLTWLSPAHRAPQPVHRAVDGLEPYVRASDVYSQPPYVGRGGWSWCTGAAAWLHRAAVESIFGLRLGARELSFTPCLPSHWHRAEMTLVRDGRTMRFILLRERTAGALAAAGEEGARLLGRGEVLAWEGLGAVSCFVVALGKGGVRAPPSRAPDPRLRLQPLQTP